MIEGTNLNDYILALKEAGYKKIAISCGNTRAYPKYNADNLPQIDGWPSIWRISEKFGYGKIVGNSHQRQANSNLQKDIRDIYRMLSNAGEEFKIKYSPLLDTDAFEVGLVIDLENYKPHSKAFAVLYKNNNVV